MEKTWFITGASRGFGRVWAEAALKRGDKVTEATTEAVPKLVDTNDPPLRLGLGNSILPRAREAYAAPGDVGSMGGRVECCDGRTEEGDDRVD